MYPTKKKPGKKKKTRINENRLNFRVRILQLVLHKRIDFVVCSPEIFDIFADSRCENDKNRSLSDEYMKSKVIRVQSTRIDLVRGYILCAYR